MTSAIRCASGSPWDCWQFKTGRVLAHILWSAIAGVRLIVVDLSSNIIYIMLVRSVPSLGVQTSALPDTPAHVSQVGDVE